MAFIKIIIADDMEEVHDDIKKSLESKRDAFFDYEIIREFYGTRDLKLFVKSYDDSEHDTVLLLDNLFGGRPDGLQALSSLRRNCPTLPIIMLTTCDDDDRSFTLAKEKYGVEYIAKPVTGSELRFRLEAAIEKAQEAPIHERLGNIEKKLDDLTAFVKNDLQNTILREKANMARGENPLGNDESIASFIERLSQYINRNVGNSNELVHSETEVLRGIFGDRWGRLLESSRASLVSAGVIWKSCEGIADVDFDYSGVCISATSALEAELKRVFFDSFQDFLRRTYGEPNAEKWEETFRNWPEQLLTCTRWEYEFPKGYRKPPLGPGYIFTMGKLPYLFGKDDRKSNPEQQELVKIRMNEYLKTIIREKENLNPLSLFYGTPTSFVAQCERVRNDYRNKAAHIDIIRKETARSCFEEISGKIGLLNELYANLE